MNEIVGWVGLVFLIFVFYMILKPQKWEKDLRKDIK